MFQRSFTVRGLLFCGNARNGKSSNANNRGFIIPQKFQKVRVKLAELVKKGN
jgi:hypothetical protein